MTSEEAVRRPQEMFRASLGQASRWPVVGVLALVSLILGYIGWAQYFGARPDTVSIWDLLYLDVQLFFLQSGAVPGPLPVTLEIARFLAFSVAAIAAVKGVAVLARDRVAALRRRLVRDHTVIVGLGDKGRFLAESFLAEGAKVVAVDADAVNDAIPELRALGANVLVGDGTDPATLANAGVARAAHLIAFTGSDETNAEIATQARSLVAGRSGAALSCVAHVVDADLSSLLRLEEMSAGATDQFRLDFFNVAEAGARLVLDRVPPDRVPAGGASNSPSVVVIGDGPLARQVDAQVRRRLAGRGVVVSSPTQEGVDVSAARVIYVCPTDEQSALMAVLGLRARMTESDASVVAVLERFGGLAGLLDRSGGRTHHVDLAAVAVLPETCRAEVVLGGTLEVLARAIHQEYIETRARDGIDPGAEQSTEPWATLSDALQESNRDQAAHIGVKLRAAGCTLVPVGTAGAADGPGFSFSTEELEWLAVMEHDRWVAERRRNGWTYRPGNRDVATKTTPHLVEWADLAEDVRAYDRVVVTEMPRVLARAGFRIVRVAEGLQ